MNKLIFEYCFYAAVIILGLLILGLMKRKNKLPSHQELKAKLESWAEKLKTLMREEESSALTNFDFYKKVSELLYRLDKLAYDTVQLAEKERDMEIAGIAALLESAQKELAPYKTGKSDGIQSAFSSVEAKISDAIAITEQILLRDKEYKSRKKQDS